MNFSIDLEKESGEYNKSIHIGALSDFAQFENEIKIFNDEIKWDGMWTIEQAQHRLSNNWSILFFKPEYEIKGWYWLDNTNSQPHSLYINKSYRNQGWGLKMQKRMIQLGKDLGLKKLVGFVDDWNKTSIDIMLRAGWRIEK